MSDLAQRIQRLEDIESIKQLKAKYLHACDRKDIAAIRECFLASDVIIDYGAIGRFTDREGLIAVFEEMAAKTGVIDAHHGQNPQIEILDNEQAQATWDLYFYQVNPDANTVTQLAGFYKDRYEKTGNEWKIKETVFEVSSSFMGNYNDESLKVLFAGAAPSV